ncbi:hypothetical protein [Methylobacterium mesophilicum]|uniref:hypothetical protein n=1 Tax=Methylobacterium mesophilicum TaxID=39956 RepID=UPI0002C6039D|nr:hypothetical protein [Methylobacterium mesophilicum]
MSLNDLIGPACAAAVFTLGGYAVVNANRKHADAISQVLWTVLCICASLILLGGLAQIPPKSPQEIRGFQKSTDQPPLVFARGSID